MPSRMVYPLMGGQRPPMDLKMAEDSSADH